MVTTVQSERHLQGSSQTLQGRQNRIDDDPARKPYDQPAPAVLLSKSARSGAARSTGPLTPLEARTLEMLGAGKPYKAVAHECRITEGAVKARVSSARRKLGARNLAHALVIAMSRRLIVGPGT